MTVGEIRAAVLSHDRLRIRGGGSQSHWLPNDQISELQISGHAGVVDYWPDDRVITVRAGTRLGDIQQALAERKQCLPISEHEGRTIGGLLAMGHPHRHESRFGAWRDWVTGMTILRADGEVAKSGSRVIKSVAGYDIHRLMVGSRGGLGVILEATLRVFARPADELLALPEHAAVVRVPRSRVNQVAGAVAKDEDSGTVWCRAIPQDVEDGWILGLAGYRRGPRESELEAAIKAKFDPSGRFAEGFDDTL